MQISRVETFVVRIPLTEERRMISSLGRHEVSNYVLVRVETDAGIVGVGEATVMPLWSGETATGAQSLINHVLAPVLVGVDPFDVAEVSRRMDGACAHNWFAKAALEMACWDLMGKKLAKPVYELLGGPRRGRTFCCRFSLGAYSTERARRVTAERIEAGFTTIKVKVGGALADDLARVRAVRDVIGSGRELVIDANCAWDADTAITAIRALDDCDIALVEQPTPDGDYEGLARVRRETGKKIMADDICFDLVHAQELLRQECCDVISVYPGKNGGIARSRAIALLAAEHGVACSIGSNLEWDVATSAMAHLVVGVENLRVEEFPGDCLGPIYHEESIAVEPVVIEGPMVTAPDRPGLGIEVDWSAVERLAIRP